jgi:drug/metabolite transporter (DMT)-like permease
MTAILFGIAAAVAWGVADFCARFSGRTLGAVVALFGVMISGAAGLTVWLLVAGHPLPLPAQVPPVAWAFALASLLGMIGLYEALRRGPVTTVAPLAGAFPAWSVVLMMVFEGLHPSWPSLSAMVATMAGMGIVARFADEGPDGANPPDRLCVPIALASGLMFGVSLTLGRHAAIAMGDMEAVWVARLLGGLVLAPVALRQGVVRGGVALPWVALVAVQGLLDAGGFLALLLAGDAAAMAVATVVSSTFGLITIALARLVLRERIAPLQRWGIALVFGGVVALTALN